MIQPTRLLAVAASLAILASACGGTAVAPTGSPTPTVVATATKLVVPATAQGATSVKLTENALVLANGSAPYLVAGNYLSTVSLVTLEKGGRTVAHKHGGIESIFVLEGVVDFRTANGSVILKQGQGASVPPNTPLQAVNGGDSVAKFIAFFMTQDTATFQTPVDVAP